MDKKYKAISTIVTQEPRTEYGSKRKSDSSDDTN